MKVQGKMFIWLAVFILAMAIVYGVWSKEPAGTTALFLAFGLSIMIGFYLAFTARRVDAGAQDNKDADVADDAGEVGFFSPHSWQPLVPGRRWRARLHGRRLRLVAAVLLGPDHPGRPLRAGSSSTTAVRTARSNTVAVTARRGPDTRQGVRARLFAGRRPVCTSLRRAGTDESFIA